MQESACCLHRHGQPCQPKAIKACHLEVILQCLAGRVQIKRPAVVLGDCCTGQHRAMLSQLVHKAWIAGNHLRWPEADQLFGNETGQPVLRTAAVSIACLA